MRPESKVHAANMGPIWGRQDPDGPHVGPMNFILWGVFTFQEYISNSLFKSEAHRFGVNFAFFRQTVLMSTLILGALSQHKRNDWNM